MFPSVSLAPAGTRDKLLRQTRSAGTGLPRRVVARDPAS